VEFRDRGFLEGKMKREIKSRVKKKKGRRAGGDRRERAEGSVASAPKSLD